MPGRDRSLRLDCSFCGADTVPKYGLDQEYCKACSSGHKCPFYKYKLYKFGHIYVLSKEKNYISITQYVLKSWVVLLIDWLNDWLIDLCLTSYRQYFKHFNWSFDFDSNKCMIRSGYLPCKKYCNVMMIGMVLILHVDFRLPFTKTAKGFISMVGNS